MKQVDMSDKAVTARLKRVAQLRRLGLSLQRAKLPEAKNSVKASQPNTESSKQDPRGKAK
jgi:hypothetical protein